MLAILILGLSGVVGGASPSSPAPTIAERPNGARPVLPQADLPTWWSFEVPVKDATSNSQTVCAIRVLRADPSIDRGIVRAVERPVDPEMVVPSVCAAR
jgi:hypothetical protein